MPYNVPFIRPAFPSSAIIGADFDEIVASNWYTNFGPKEREFAKAIADYLGDGLQAVPFSNATIALMALRARRGRIGKTCDCPDLHICRRPRSNRVGRLSTAPH